MVSIELWQVNSADLYTPHLLNYFYQGLFTNMMEWVKGFLKMHKQQQACNYVRKDFHLIQDSLYHK